jgi:glycosyltransferase involved in cell wall biosynthesis
MAHSIAAVVGVRDEVELIEPCICHLYASGIESVVVVDNNSSDGTEIVLDRLAAIGKIRLLRAAAGQLPDVQYFMRGIELARSAFSPEWILIQDADEFWIHRSGNLAQLVSNAHGDVLLVDRFNACLSDRLASELDRFQESALRKLDIFVQSLRLSRNMMDTQPHIPWIAGKPGEKVIARAAAIAGVSAGGHGIIGVNGEQLTPSRVSDAVIVHIPFSTETRFRRKIENVRDVMSTYPQLFSGEAGWHWRRWLDILAADELHTEFANQYLSSADIEELRHGGIVSQAGTYLGLADATA